jgi:hypothetical protein
MEEGEAESVDDITAGLTDIAGLPSVSTVTPLPAVPTAVPQAAAAAAAEEDELASWLTN